MSTALTTCLRLDDVSLAFGDRILFSHLSMSLEPGQMAGIAGESGCGKTSLLRAVLGFVPVAHGSISVCGMELSQHTVDAIRHHTAYVPQELQPPVATGRDLVMLTHDLRANRGATSLKTIETTLESLGIDDPALLDMPAAKLSGGQRQRILLAAALTLPKPLLLLDEPTSALDADTSAQVVEVLRQTCRLQRRAALIVSHSSLVLDACDITLNLTA